MSSTAPKTSELIKSLPRMSPAELRQLQAAAGMLLQGQPTGEPDGAGVGTDVDLEMVYDRVKEVLRDCGVLRCPPISLLHKTGQMGDLKKGAPVVMDYVNEFFRPKTTLERSRAVGFLVEQVVNRLRQQNIPVSLKTVVQGLRRVNDAVDSQFPGYQASGLLPMILTRPKTGNGV